MLFGKEFVAKYIEYCLPSLLASENLPLVADEHSVNYTIYCPLSDFREIAESKVFEKICSIGGSIKINHKIISNNYLENDPSGHHLAWQDSISQIAGKNECVIFIIPDNVFSSNCVSRWVKLLEHGYTHILAPSPYTLEESAIKTIDSYKNNSLSKIEINQEDILNIYKNNIHPLSSCMEVGQTIVTTHPEHRIRVCKNSLFIRTITSNPMVIDFSKREKKIVVDQIRSLSLEPLKKYSKFGFLLNKSIKEKFNYGPWLNSFLNEDCAVEFQYEHKIQFNEKNIRYTLTRSGDRFYRWSLSVRALHKLAKELKSEGCLISSCLLLELMRYQPVKMHELFNEAICIVCPKDKIINEEVKYKLLLLLQKNNHNEIILMIENFFIKNDEEKDNASIFFGIGKLKRLKLDYKSVYIVEETNIPKWSKVEVYITDQIAINWMEKDDNLIKNTPIKFDTAETLKKWFYNAFPKIIPVFVATFLLFEKFVPDILVPDRYLKIKYRIGSYKDKHGQHSLNDKINERATNIIKIYFNALFGQYQKIIMLKSTYFTSYKIIKLFILNYVRQRVSEMIKVAICSFTPNLETSKVYEQSSEDYNKNMTFISWNVLNLKRIMRGESVAHSHDYIETFVIKNIFEKYDEMLVVRNNIPEEEKIAIAVTFLSYDVSRDHALEYISNIIKKNPTIELNSRIKELLIRAALVAARVYTQLDNIKFSEECYSYALTIGDGDAVTSKDRLNFKKQKIVFPNSFEILYNSYVYLPKQIFK